MNKKSIIIKMKMIYSIKYILFTLKHFFVVEFVEYHTNQIKKNPLYSLNYYHLMFLQKYLIVD